MSMQNQVSRKFGSDYSVGNVDAMKDVQLLIADGVTSVDVGVLNRLRSKYSNSEIVDLVLESLTERLATIKARARKFARAVLKHTGPNTPLHTMLKRALKYKDRLGLNDAEFELFRKELHSTLEGEEQGVVVESRVSNSIVGRALGQLEVETSVGLTVEQQDYPYLQEILRIHSLSKPIHSQVMLQSLLYRSFALEAIDGKYDASKHNAAHYISPVLAAMFLPKINFFETMLLQANIAHIVKCRYEKSPTLTAPDYLLLHAMITDPNDVACSMDSPFKDLRNRAALQEHVWNSVLALRTGRYYDISAPMFLSAIDNCRLTNIDAPDSTYIGDESTVMRRLLQAFSCRPTVVTTMPIFGVAGAPVSGMPVLINRVTSIPMFTVRLPPAYIPTIDDTPISLLSQTTNPQYYLENNTLVPKIQTILYTRGVMLFHVNRRTQKPNFQAIVQPQNWTNILPTISAYERVNTRAIDVENYIPIGGYDDASGERLYLASVVTVNVNPYMPDQIIGTSALLVDNSFEADNMNNGIVIPGMAKYYRYDPQLAYIKQYADVGENMVETQPPVTFLYKESTGDRTGFTDLASKYGVIYIYYSPDRKMYNMSTGAIIA